MNKRTKLRVLNFLKFKSVEARSIDNVDMDFQSETLDIIYVSSSGGAYCAYEMANRDDIEEFLEYLSDGESMTYTEDTMNRAHGALVRSGLDLTQADDAINGMQNEGIFFREIM